MQHDALEFALMLAQAAEEAILPVFRKCTIRLKADGSEVTEGDRRAEEVMRELIAKHLPGHDVLGEEFGGPGQPSTGPLWVLDPIDGTASFALGLPIFGTLIGYLENGEPQLGVIHCPAMGETTYAARNLGCWTRVKGNAAVQVKVSSTAELKDAYISSYPWNAVPQPRRSRPISDCVQHALVAQGRIDAAIDPSMKPWDIAAIVPCVEEAGGVASDLHGERDRIVWKTSLLTSCSSSLQHEIINAVRVSVQTC
jgi:histidinol-phosphatase